MDKVLLVTGASRGIGAATALLAAREGYAVAVNYAHRAEVFVATVEALADERGELPA